MRKSSLRYDQLAWMERRRESAHERHAAWEVFRSGVVLGLVALFVLQNGVPTFDRRLGGFRG